MWRVEGGEERRMEEDSEYEIAVAHVCQGTPDCDALLRKAVAAALRRHQTAAARISVALVDDARIAALNQLHLHHEGATDVLTFDLRDGVAPGAAPDGRVPAALDGEIVISVDTAAREARARGHDVDAELALHAVHGTLHLLGYDDRTEQTAVRMHALEDEILTQIGVGAVYGTGLP